MAAPLERNGRSVLAKFAKKNAGDRNKLHSKASASNGDTLSDTQMQSLEKELQRTGVGMEAVQDRKSVV